MRLDYKYEDLLRNEGFSNVYVWEDGADTYYPEHSHKLLTAHIVVTGEMHVTVDGKSRRYVAGERCDVPANTPHSAKMGPNGCRYVVGEK